MLLALLLLPFFVLEAHANLEVYTNYLREGDAHIMAGKSSYDSAVRAYTFAIQINPSDSRAYFRRADAHKLLKNYKKAIADLDEVLKLEPNHKRALLMQTSFLLHTSDLDGAARSYRILADINQRENNQEKSKEFLRLAHELSTITHRLTMVQKAPFQHAHECISVYSTLLEKYVRDSIDFRLRRAECAIFIKDHALVREDLRHLLVLNPKNVEVLLLNARELRSLGAIEEAQKQVKRCLNLDPENRPCRTLSKEIKSNKGKYDTLTSLITSNQWSKAVQHTENWIKESDSNRFNLDYDQPMLDQLKFSQCQAYLHLREVKLGLAACNLVLEIRGEDSPNIWEVHLYKAELHTLEEDMNAAMQELEKSRSHGGNNHQRFHDVSAKLDKLKQQLSRKNYYKILDVPRDASKQKIRKSFRKLAMKYHPDKVQHESDAEKERLAAIYRDINEAKEVLLDDDKRKRYDDGEDIFGGNQQQQQQQRGHDPFFQFMNGGGFQFHFNQ